MPRYERLVRRIVRLELEDRRLLRTFESLDVCQPVRANVFVRAAAGPYDLRLPGDQARLLAAIARKKRDQRRPTR